MLQVLFGNATAEKVLLYLANYSEGYASAIATTFGLRIFSVQKQLSKFEMAGVLVSQKKGRTRVYYWNPRYPFRKELQALLDRMIEFTPEDEIRKYFRQRQRPRRAGKPL